MVLTVPKRLRCQVWLTCSYVILMPINDTRACNVSAGLLVNIIVYMLHMLAISCAHLSVNPE